MIGFPIKRVWGMLGSPRSGKDTVANYLQETRNFAPIAFADKIKEEFGISKEDFEAAKITGNIDKLRQDLWEFSAKKKANNPTYFIDMVVDEAVNSDRSVIITDIRTEDEFNALFERIPKRFLPRAYFVVKNNVVNDQDGIMSGSKLRYRYIYDAMSAGRVKSILNNVAGVSKLFRHLDNYFFAEDVADIVESNSQYYSNDIRNLIAEYTSNFNIIDK